MDIFLFVLGIFAVLHFFVEAILVPSWRLQLRYRLFELRDRLRALEVEDRYPGATVRQVCQRLESSINTAISLVPKIGPRLIYEFQQRLASDDGLRRTIDERIAYVENNAPAEVRALNAEVARILRDACAANTAGWVVYVFPALLALLFYDSVAKRTSELSALSDSETERLVPDIFATPA